jgi:hypothetical protein
MTKAPVKKTPPSAKAVVRNSPRGAWALESTASVSPKPSVVKPAQPVVAGEMMRKKELIDTVVERSGIKKKDAKPVVEAMLAVLGSAIADGRELNLQPFGKLKVNRSKDVPNGKVMICKLRRSDNAVGSQAVNAIHSGAPKENSAADPSE